MAIIKKCKNCGIKFKTYPSINKINCSKTCSYELQRKETALRKTRKCVVCGKSFIPKHTKSKGVYCSYKCAGVGNRKDYVLRNGYYYAYSENHPNRNKQGYVPLHHLIFEECHGFIIEKGYVVHHINGKKTDNRITNLQLMTDSDHKSLHASNDCYYRNIGARKEKKYKVFGSYYSVSELEKEYNISRYTIYDRLKRGLRGASLIIKKG